MSMFQIRMRFWHPTGGRRSVTRASIWLRYPRARFSGRPTRELSSKLTKLISSAPRNAAQKPSTRTSRSKRPAIQAVERVYYPSLPSSWQYALAKKQMSGFGGMVSLELRGGFPAVERFVVNLKLFQLAESLGAVESLVSYPSKMTHASLSAEERAERGIKDNLVRLSVGIEDESDLRDDLEGALSGMSVEGAHP